MSPPRLGVSNVDPNGFTATLSDPAWVFGSCSGQAFFADGMSAVSDDGGGNFTYVSPLAGEMPTSISLTCQVSQGDGYLGTQAVWKSEPRITAASQVWRHSTRCRIRSRRDRSLTIDCRNRASGWVQWLQPLWKGDQVVRARTNWDSSLSTTRPDSAYRVVEPTAAERRAWGSDLTAVVQFTVRAASGRVLTLDSISVVVRHQVDVPQYGAISTTIGGSFAGFPPTEVGGLPGLGKIIPRQLPRYIAYDGAAGGVRLITPDGSDAHQVGPPDASHPVWSPDASEILYQAAAPPNSGGASSDTYVMNADGSGQHPIMVSAGCEGDLCWYDSGFHWAPDGKRIVFVGSGGIVIAHADGTDAQPVGIGGFGAENASFSPDGSYLVFDSTGPLVNPDSVPADYNIYAIRTDGAGLQQITHDGGVDPSWSPDGNSIIYGCDLDSSDYAHGVCEITRGDPTPQTLYTDPTRTISAPTWNATGSEIFLTIGETDGTHQIALLSPSGGTPTEITHPPGSNFRPDW